MIQKRSLSKLMQSKVLTKLWRNSMCSNDYPSIAEKSKIAILLKNSDDDLCKDITSIIASLFDCMTMVASSKHEEAMHSSIKKIYALLKERFPEEFK
jgi:hypothetical protein